MEFGVIKKKMEYLVRCLILGQGIPLTVSLHLKSKPNRILNSDLLVVWNFVLYSKR